jgi:hypothetical protein
MMRIFDMIKTFLNDVYLNPVFYLNLVGAIVLGGLLLVV